MMHELMHFDLSEKQLHGSGGWIVADITDEQAKKLFALWEQNCIIKLNKDGSWGKI